VWRGGNKTAGAAAGKLRPVSVPDPMMMKPVALSCLLLLAAPAVAFAGSFVGSSAGASSAGSSASSGASSDSSSGNDKVVLEARNDAAGFVASDGRIRGARLDAALFQLRERSEAARSASDMDLARAILAQ
jgi:uncharacterized protein (TIGR02448 family)